MITQSIKSEIKNLSHQTENEICGFLLSNGSLYPCQNKSLNPLYHFSIDPKDYLRANFRGIELVYHSHQRSNEFSEFDKINLYNQKLRGLLYCKEKDNFKMFLPESYNNKYVGRAFEIGVSDCLSIVSDYYKEELNIKLPEIIRGADWYKKNPNIIKENTPTNLKKIENTNIQKNDILAFDMLNNGAPCHFGIYLGNDIMLHHPRFRLSTIEILNETLKKKLAYGLRLRWN